MISRVGKDGRWSLRCRVVNSCIVRFFFKHFLLIWIVSKNSNEDYLGAFFFFVCPISLSLSLSHSFDVDTRIVFQ